MVESLYLLASMMMVGIIWLIQVVHYPSFSYVENSVFVSFHEFHSKKITLIVFPCMLLELLISGYFSLTLHSYFWIAQFVLVLLLWSSTMFISVPIHNQLLVSNQNTRKALVRKLVETNWIRTILWSLKSGLILLFRSELNVFK